MMKIFKALAFIAALLAAASCGDDGRFRISGTIEGDPTMNLRVHYYTGGRFNSQITAARGGEFEFYGVSPVGTVVEIYDYDYRLLGRTYATNGNDISLRLARQNPLEIEASGNHVAQEWARFLRSNADSLAAGPLAANRAIGRYVADNTDNLVSTLLVITSYDTGRDPLGADSLLELISPAVRPAALTEGYNYLLQRLVDNSSRGPVLPFRYLDRRDSLRTFDPADAELSLLVVDNNRSGRVDSIVPELKRLRASAGRKLAVLEYSVDYDTIEWKRSTRRDTATWTQAWGAGGISARGLENLAVPTVPYFIVCDTAGTQLLRTPALTPAKTFILTRLGM